VVAIGEHRAFATPEPVERAGDAHEQALHPARERFLVVRLGDQVDVVRLQGVLGEAEAESLASGAERALDLRTGGATPEARQARAQTHGDVDGMASRQLLPRAVRHTASRTGALAACSATTAAPRTELELPLAQSLSLATHGKASPPLL
jgi:hypothetical protein